MARRRGPDPQGKLRRWAAIQSRWAAEQRRQPIEVLLDGKPAVRASEPAHGASPGKEGCGSPLTRPTSK